MDALKLDADAERECARELQAYFAAERDEDLGDLGARLLYQFVAERIGWRFFNLGVERARQVMAQGAATLDEEMEAAKRLPPRGAR